MNLSDYIKDPKGQWFIHTGQFPLPHPLRQFNFQPGQPVKILADAFIALQPSLVYCQAPDEFSEDPVDVEGLNAAKQKNLEDWEARTALIMVEADLVTRNDNEIAVAKAEVVEAQAVIDEKPVEASADITPTSKPVKHK